MMQRLVPAKTLKRIVAGTKEKEKSRDMHGKNEGTHWELKYMVLNFLESVLIFSNYSVYFKLIKYRKEML